MNSKMFRKGPQNTALVYRLLWMFSASFAMLVNIGCGTVTTPAITKPVNQPLGNTSVTLTASGTADARVSKFIVPLTTITLTDASGNTISILPTPLTVDFIHINGVLEPLATVNIPQGTYTSATAAVGGPAFFCIAHDPVKDGLLNAEFASGQIPASQINVNLPAPITITGTAMTLTLNLLVSPSATFSPCLDAPNYPYSITPTFTLSPVASPVAPTPSSNTNVSGLLAIIGSLNTSGNGFSANPIGNYFAQSNVDKPMWQVTTTPTTVYQGVTSFSSLTPDMTVDMDTTIQPDGSLVATRIAVYDPDTTNQTVSQGPLLYQNEYQTSIEDFGVEGQGPRYGINATTYDFNNSIYHISGELTNISSLPFNPSFTPTSMVAGQNAFFTTHVLHATGGFPYTQADTITLLPQTINGTVDSISTSGNFTTYTISLAPYDLFPNLAVQGGQKTLLNNPATVVVYADNKTQLLNTTPIAAGTVLRFHGLVFNDNGTLRMDCEQINDGVPN